MRLSSRVSAIYDRAKLMLVGLEPRTSLVFSIQMQDFYIPITVMDLHQREYVLAFCSRSARSSLENYIVLVAQTRSKHNIELVKLITR